jgi:hypothetical protein
MSDETAPKWTIQTGEGALLPEELRAFVDAWLEEAGGDPLRALVFAAQDAATLERAPATAYAAGRTGEAGETKDKAFRRARFLSAAPERVVASYGFRLITSRT